MNNNIIFEQVYNFSTILREAKTFLDADSIINSIKDGTIIKLLNGKKNLPSWLKNDIDNNKNIDEIKYCFSTVLDLISNNPNNGINETIYLLIKKSSSLDEMKTIINKSKDALLAYALSIKSQWIKNVDIAKTVENSPYNEELWHEMEKQLLEIKSKKQAVKHKKILNSSELYDTLYEDGIWGLYIPKSQIGDSELASHICPFEYEGKIYNKTRWCTAAGQNYYDNYSEDGNCFYVIKYFNNNEYTDAWQIAFWRPDVVEFMDKTDSRNYNFVLDNAPDALLEKIVCDNKLNNRLTLQDFNRLSTEAINNFRITNNVQKDALDAFFSIISRDIWVKYVNTVGLDYSLNDFFENYEGKIAKEMGLIDERVSDEDIRTYGAALCKRYTDLLKKYPRVDINYFTPNELHSLPVCPWDEYLSDINDGRIVQGIYITEYWECGREAAQKYSKYINEINDGIASNKFTLYDFTNLSDNGLSLLNKIIEYKKQGKLKNARIEDVLEEYSANIDPVEVLDYLDAVSKGKCLKFPKHIYGPKAYANCARKDLLAQAAQDAEAGLIPDNILPTVYDTYNRDDVIKFYELAKKGAFDNTATLKQYVEYGAQNLNDINILKHQNKLWPTFSIEDCFMVGPDEILKISKELFDNNCDKSFTLDDYYTYGIDVLKAYTYYSELYPDAYFTENLENFYSTFEEPCFKEFIEAINNPKTDYYKDYAIDYFKRMQYEHSA